MASPANRRAPSAPSRALRPLPDEQLSRLVHEAVALLADAVATRIPRFQPPADPGGPAALLRRQKDAAEACGLALTEFKQRLQRREVPANYEAGTPRSYDAETLRLWALAQYPPFDPADPVSWTVWLYSKFGLNVLGGRLAA